LQSARRSLFIAAQWLFAAAIVWYALRSLRGQWSAAGDRLASLHVSWAWVAFATVIVLATYVLLIDAWRRVVIAAGDRLPFPVAARIWFVSNLGKYVPGKIWSIAAMTMMSRDVNVSPLAAAGSSVLMQLVTIGAGVGVVLVAGANAVDQRGVAIMIGAVIAAIIASIPVLLPALASVLNALTGRSFALPRIPSSVVWAAAGKSAISWVAYGISFQLFVRATLGSAAGDTSSYIAVYAASYIIGFLALFAPGGAVVRESAMIGGMLKLGLSNQADALAVAIASRLWLTATELLPGLVYLALGKRADRLNR
jgi:hypothetical protein